MLGVVKYWNEKTSTCILRVARDHANTLISSLVNNILVIDGSVDKTDKCKGVILNKVNT